MRSFQDERVLSGTPVLGKPEGFVSPSPGLPRGGAGGEATLGQPAASSSNSEGVAAPLKSGQPMASFIPSQNEAWNTPKPCVSYVRSDIVVRPMGLNGWAMAYRVRAVRHAAAENSPCREFPLACKPHRLYTLSDRTKTMSTRMDNAAQALPGARTSGTPLEPVRIPNCGPLHRRSMAGKRQTHFFPSPPDITGEDAPSGPDRPVGGCKSLPISLVKPSRRT